MLYQNLRFHKIESSETSYFIKKKRDKFIVDCVTRIENITTEVILKMYTYRVLSEFCKLILKLSHYFTFLKRFKKSRFFYLCGCKIYNPTFSC